MRAGLRQCTRRRGTVRRRRPQPRELPGFLSHDACVPLLPTWRRRFLHPLLEWDAWARAGERGRRQWTQLEADRRARVDAEIDATTLFLADALGPAAARDAKGIDAGGPDVDGVLAETEAFLQRLSAPAGPDVGEASIPAL